MCKLLYLMPGSKMEIKKAKRCQRAWEVTLGSGIQLSRFTIGSRAVCDWLGTELSGL